MTLIGRALAVSLACGVTGCQSSPARDRDRAPRPASAASAPQQSSARRTAGVLGPTALDGGVYGGLIGSEPEPIPGLPPLPPRGPCEEAIGRVRQLLCSGKIERGDRPEMVDIRDVVIESCAGTRSSAAAGRACVAKARTVADLRACPRAARPRAPADCDLLRLHLLKLALVDDACPADGSALSRYREGYFIQSAANAVRPTRWDETCKKTRIPRQVMDCVMAAATTTESARCGL